LLSDFLSMRCSLCGLLLQVALSLSLFVCYLFAASYLAYLHSFPTRRSSDLRAGRGERHGERCHARVGGGGRLGQRCAVPGHVVEDRKSTRLNSSHVKISYAVFCLKKKR